MTFAEYQVGVVNTWNRGVSFDEQVENALYGLFGELGEFVEYYKKVKFHATRKNRDYEKKELGDILYYLTALIDVRDFDLESIVTANHLKLKKRYPKGFKTGGGIR